MSIITSFLILIARSWIFRNKPKYRITKSPLHLPPEKGLRPPPLEKRGATTYRFFNTELQCQSRRFSNFCTGSQTDIVVLDNPPWFQLHFNLLSHLHLPTILPANGKERMGNLP